MRLYSAGAAFWIGVVLFALSFFPFVAGRSQSTLVLGNVFFSVGYILVMDAVSFRLGGSSILGSPHPLRHFLHFSVAGIAAGVLLEGFAQWLGKLWYYPYFSVGSYALWFVGGFVMYSLLVFESYEGIKAVVRRFMRPRRVRHRRFEPRLYTAFWRYGLLGIPAGVFVILLSYDKGYRFVIDSPLYLRTAFLGVLIVFLSVYLLLEYFEYRRRESSLLERLINRDYAPLVSILIASVVLSLVMEVQNAPLGFWRYFNLPGMDVLFLGVPVAVFLAWPLQYFAFLSFYRAFFEKKDDVWN